MLDGTPLLFCQLRYNERDVKQKTCHMPIRSPRNEYRGINAHLHSYFQMHGGWDGFHNKHVGDLGAAISSVLPPGYLVDTEQSLQLREIAPYGEERIRRWRPDIAVYSPSATATANIPQPSNEATATLVQPLLDTFYDEEVSPALALLIYKIDDESPLGRTITQIELLSPSNKSGEGRHLYLEKRIALLNAGINLVELDYLHETDPIVRGVPSYARHETGAHAYNFTISIPSPSLREGKAVTTSFDTDMPIPALELPLVDSQRIQIDLDAVYQQTFISVNAYSYRVDYEQLPERFESYMAGDQGRIQGRMTATKQALSA